MFSIRCADNEGDAYLGVNVQPTRDTETPPYDQAVTEYLPLHSNRVREAGAQIVSPALTVGEAQTLTSRSAESENPSSLDALSTLHLQTRNIDSTFRLSKSQPISKFCLSVYSNDSPR